MRDCPFLVTSLWSIQKEQPKILNQLCVYVGKDHWLIVGKDEHKCIYTIPIYDNRVRTIPVPNIYYTLEIGNEITLRFFFLFQ